MLIFYRPENLQIMGFSDKGVSMDFPYIEVEENYHSSDWMYLERNGDKVELKFSRLTL